MEKDCNSCVNTIVVFDFDLTIIDCDSDPWVMEQLGVGDMFQELLKFFPWNSAMDKMMEELHSQGKTLTDIENALKTVPLFPETVRAIKHAHSHGCDLRIVSDANIVFIKTILEYHGLQEYFTEINTNPVFLEENGRLRIQPFHPFTATPPHGCALCPPNMCKGAIIERMQESGGEEKRFVYLGDGSGDFCPSLKLKFHDHVLPRKDFPVWRLIERNRDKVKAQVHPWCDALDMEVVLSTVLTMPSNQIGTSGCSANQIETPVLIETPAF